jgi:hypothetical protein
MISNALCEPATITFSRLIEETKHDSTTSISRLTFHQIAHGNLKPRGFEVRTLTWFGNEG